MMKKTKKPSYLLKFQPKKKITHNNKIMTIYFRFVQYNEIFIFVFERLTHVTALTVDFLAIQ